MTEDDRKRLSVAIGALGEVFGRSITSITIRAYEVGLAGLPIRAIEQACSRAIRERKFMPVPSELRELAGEIRPEDRAVKAWAAVQGALRGHDYYQTVVFDDPLTTATVRHLWHDWMQFTEAAEASAEHWLRKEFERVYLALMRTGIAPSDTHPLLGSFEQDNRLHGYTAKPPLMIACGLPALPGLTYTPKPVARIGGPPLALLENIGAMPETRK